MGAANEGLPEVDGILQGLSTRSRPHLARAISMVEDGARGFLDILSFAYKRPRRSAIVGITGSPGVGKSTIVNGVIEQFRSMGRTVGVIAVDPTSPFSGGAILGDRVRVRSHSMDDGLFFRSLATRGHLGGLSRHTGDVIAVMDAFGFDDILVETVGAGQSEVDIMRYAQTVIVALAPNLGDDVQAIKAGILEIGDVFCLNKADLPGAERTRRDIEMMLNLKEDAGWRPPIVLTKAHLGEGLAELVGAVGEHRRYLSSSDLLKEKVRQSGRAVLREYLDLLTVERILKEAEKDGALENALTSLSKGEADPLTCAGELIEKYLLSFRVPFPHDRD